MELARIAASIRRYWWVLLIGALVGSVLSLEVTRRIEPVYQSAVKLLINPAPIPGVSGYPDTVMLDRLSRTYADVMQSRPVLDETIKQLTLPITVGDLSKRVNVRQVRDSQIMEVSVQDTDPNRAAAIANRLSVIFLERNRELQSIGAKDARRETTAELANLRQKIDDTSKRLGQVRTSPAANGESAGEVTRLQGELTQYQELYFRLLETQQRMTLAQAQAVSSISIVEPALPPPAPIWPLPRQSAVLAGLVGLLLALGLVLARDLFDDRVREPDQVRRLFGLESLAALPFSKEGAGQAPATASLAGGDPFAEALRVLRTNLSFVAPATPLVVAVASPSAGTGASTVAAHLAVAEAQAGRRVILVDGDLRTPGRQHHTFGLSNQHGLSTHLAAPQSEEPPLQEGPLGIKVLTSGPAAPNPAVLLGSHRLTELMAALRQRADIVIVDSPPVLAAADTPVLRRTVDGVILILDPLQTRRGTIEHVLASLRMTTIYGVVFNKVRGSAEQGGGPALTAAPRPARWARRWFGWAGR